jgi:hypothetical protein
MLEEELAFNNPASSLCRSPRMRVLVNGQALQGAYEAEVTSSGHYSADTFSLAIACSADPWADARFWSSQSMVLVDIQVSLDVNGSFTSLIVGRADSISFDPLRDLIRVQGRDLSASLVEAETQETFANRTASEIATIFSARHNLIPRVAPTNTPVGRFYGDDRESLTLNQFSSSTTEWDLLTSLARQERFDLWVSGTSLYFQPPVTAQPPVFILTPKAVIDIRLTRSTILARNVTVTVRSWNSSRQMLVSETATAALSESCNNTAIAPASYSVVYPNLTPDTATSLAQQRLGEIIRHERCVTFSIPGEVSLSPRSFIALEGTGTAFDQSYYIDSIERSFTPRSGFREYIRASNSSPRTITTTSS